MTQDEQILYNRFSELCKKSRDCGYFIFTDFLGLAEQSIFNSAKKGLSSCDYTAFGGTPGCERVIFRLGNPDELGYEADFPISILKIEPKSQKFADKLTHRDFLGAILNLGIERKMLGDIIIIENVGYVFTKEDIADYIATSLSRIKRTDVTVAVSDTLPCGELFKKESKIIQVSGERLDAVISKLFSISRESSLSLFKKRLVFVCGVLMENNSYTPKENDIVSVRGYGRFIYKGQKSVSKKQKLNVEVELYV